MWERSLLALLHIFLGVYVLFLVACDSTPILDKSHPEKLLVKGTEKLLPFYLFASEVYGIIEKLFVTSLWFKLGSTSKILNLSFFGLLNSVGFKTIIFTHE